MVVLWSWLSQMPEKPQSERLDLFRDWQAAHDAADCVICSEPVGEVHTVWIILQATPRVQSLGLSHEEAQDKNDWKLGISGQPANLGLPQKRPLKSNVLVSIWLGLG